jgi:hypothetical protein
VTDYEINKLTAYIDKVRAEGEQDPVGVVVSQEFPWASALVLALTGEPWPPPPPDGAHPDGCRVVLVSPRSGVAQALRDLAGESGERIARELEEELGAGWWMLELFGDTHALTVIPDPFGLTPVVGEESRAQTEPQDSAGDSSAA